MNKKIIKVKQAKLKWSEKANAYYMKLPNGDKAYYGTPMVFELERKG